MILRGDAFSIFFRRCFLLYLVGFAVFLSPAMVFADGARQGKFYFGGDLGSARMELHRGSIKNSGTWLYGALRAEYALHNQLLLGVEGAGWTDQIDIYSSISEDVLTFMMTAKIYPLQDSRAFARASWGYAKHRYWDSSTLNDASGTGYLVGLGYDIYIASLSILFSSGDLGRETYNATTFALGFTF